MEKTVEYRLGGATVTRVSETRIDFAPPKSLLPDWSDEALLSTDVSIKLEKRSGTVPVVGTSIHTWLLRANQHNILIDTGIGNHKPRSIPVFDNLNNPYLDRLAEAGVAPEDVDYVLITHIHTDHVGWNTKLVDGRWVPTFPNAKYFVPRIGCEYFESLEGRAKPNYPIYVDSVLPIIEAGQAELIDSNASGVLPGISYLSTPGHSVDHSSILFQSQGESAIFAGDVMHHPAQVYQTRWNSVFCAAGENARASRLRILELSAAENALYLSSHFVETSAGRINRTGDKFTWKFE
jgi:glyoxylase-like metal-dependent hydrolase (beta-lactamase superfamily II)